MFTDHANSVKLQLLATRHKPGSYSSTILNFATCNVCTICNSPVSNSESFSTLEFLYMFLLFQIELEKHAIDCSTCDKRLHRICNNPPVHHRTRKANFICQNCCKLPEHREKKEKIDKKRTKSIAVNRQSYQRRKSKLIEMRRQSLNPFLHSAQINASIIPISCSQEKIESYSKILIDQNKAELLENEGFPGFSKEEIENVQVKISSDHYYCE